MHFWHTHEDGVFTIRAQLHEEHGDSTTGTRFQSDKTPLKLVEQSVSFGLDVREFDPDHLALACLLLFMPFIGHKVSFSVPVSDSIVQFLASPGWASFREWPVEVVSKMTGPRKTQKQPISLSTTALALGGGFDAVALKVLLPEVFTYHTVSTIIKNGVYHFPAYHFYADRKNVRLNGKPVCDAYIWSNAESIVEPRGVATWPFFAIPALLMAKERGLNCVMSGTVFEGSFCSNGQRFSSYKANGPTDFVGKVFNDLGLRLAQAATMLPEYLNIKTVIDGGLGDHVSFCIVGPTGGPCGKCPKCYRKKLLYEAYRLEGGPSVSKFENMPIKGFDTEYMRRVHQKRPIYLASSFKWLRRRVPIGSFLPFMSEAVETVPEVRFDLGRVYSPGLEILPDGIRDPLASRLLSRYDAMRADEIEAVRQWDCYAALKNLANH